MRNHVFHTMGAYNAKSSGVSTAIDGKEKKMYNKMFVAGHCTSMDPLSPPASTPHKSAKITAQINDEIEKKNATYPV